MPPAKESIDYIYMTNGKGGTMRAPFVLSAQEAIAFLRIEGENPMDTLAYYRKRNLLNGRRMGNRMVYLLEELVKFARDGTESSRL